ncbi:MAG: hypothetical protein NZ941_01915 [Candidatus Caldarchaeum sp.]|nr:hypothetical protein [Candidatus Caldarchaeum sp.]
MIGTIEMVRSILALRPSKYTVFALAALAGILALQLIAAAYAGRPVDASHR